ncbi:hypothetical protein, partial [Streptomyces subrutilus]|uniref:hypothetical protein n=1 Tax=Streptomyces subrutilus TaxID=36818 RepID=UPI001AD83CF8
MSRPVCTGSGSSAWARAAGTSGPAATRTAGTVAQPVEVSPESEGGPGCGAGCGAGRGAAPRTGSGAGAAAAARAGAATAGTRKVPVAEVVRVGYIVSSVMRN